MRFAALALALLVALPAAAQPRYFPGQNAEQFYNSGVGLAATQLTNELTAVRNEVARSSAPLALKFEVNRLATQAVNEASALQRLASTNAGRERLIAADQQVDATVESLLAALNRGVVPSAGLADAINRARYADEQLHVALGIGNGPNPGAGDPSRLATAVADQVEYLRDLGRNGGPGYTAAIDRDLRTVKMRMDRVRRAADRNDSLTAVGEYRTAGPNWQSAGGALATSPNAQLRLQAARVDDLFRQLGDALGGNAPQPQPPGPGPLPPGFLGRGMLAVGAGEGGGPRVRIFTDLSGTSSFDFFAYDPGFRGGVRVAVADVTGDGIPDVVTAPGAGMPPLVRVFDGRTLRLAAEWMAYAPAWDGGLFVAAADARPGQPALVVTGADRRAGPDVRVFDFRTRREIDQFAAYADAYTGGVRVALGDVNGDGVPDLVTAPGPQHEPLIRVFDGRNRAVLREFYAYDRGWTGGVTVATADVSGNGRADILTGTDWGGPNAVRVFDARKGSLLGEVLPFPAGFRGGVRVAAYDFDGDGIPDVVAAPGPDDRFSPPLRVFRGRDRTPLGQFAAFEPFFRGGAFVGAR